MIEKNPNGYIALVSAIIISALLIIITFSVNFSGFFARFNILDSEYKKISLGLAEACVDTAILEIAKDPKYTGNTAIAVDGATKKCKICLVNKSGADYDFETRAGFGTPDPAHTNISVGVHRFTTGIRIDSWQEIPDGDPACTLP